MTEVLVATGAGCMEFTDSGDCKTEFAGLVVRAITAHGLGGCLAVVNGNEIWHRNADAQWSQLTSCNIGLDSIISVEDKILAATSDVALVRIDGAGKAERLTGFDTIDGRVEWFGQGPPLHIRALTATAGGGTIMAAVHVGGIPRSTDGGIYWAPTVPIDFDVHEVRAHPTLPNIVAAAAAIGLCVSADGGQSWDVFAEGPEDPHALSLAALDREMIFSVQDGPFAERAQVWRWKIGESGIEQVRDGLPDWFCGKVDTGHMAAGGGRAAIIDGGGNLWLSKEASSGFEQIARGVPYAFGTLVL
jgi:hypothetical protein